MNRLTVLPSDREGRAMSPLRVTVAGAGIAGLAAAVALRRIGAEVTVVERAERLEPLGAGLSLFPNAVRALRALGVDLEGSEIPRGDGGLWRSDGSPLVHQEAAALEERYGAPLLLVHRGELQAALLAALGDTPIRLGEAVRGAQHDGDLLVGADGIRSAVREAILGDGAPRESGIVAWRGVAEHALGDRAGEFWGEGGVVGLAPLSGGRVYWYATTRDAEETRAGLVERLASWTDPIADVVASTPPGAVLRHALADRPPAQRWSQGSVTLVGDAAHPMLPFLGQGACQALEDAVALAAAVEAQPDVPAALAAYETARRARTAPLVKRSHSAGSVTHLRNGLARRLRDAAVSHTPQRARQRQLDAVIGLRN